MRFYGHLIALPKFITEHYFLQELISINISSEFSSIYLQENDKYIYVNIDHLILYFRVNREALGLTTRSFESLLDRTKEFEMKVPPTDFGEAGT